MNDNNFAFEHVIAKADNEWWQGAQSFSHYFWQKLEAKGDGKDTEGAHCLFTEMSNLKTQLEFS